MVMPQVAPTVPTQTIHMFDPKWQTQALEHARVLKERGIPLPEACGKMHSVDACFEAVCKQHDAQLGNIYKSGFLGQVANMGSRFSTQAQALGSSHLHYGVADFYRNLICVDKLPPPNGAGATVKVPISAPAPQAMCSPSAVGERRAFIVVLGGFLAIAGIRALSLGRPQTTPAAASIINAIYIWMGWSDQVSPSEEGQYQPNGA